MDSTEGISGLRLPLTYAECRARFLRVAAAGGHPVRSHPLEARGPSGEELSLQSAWIGASRPQRALVVMSGVHGVEGFIGSALQCRLLERLATRPLSAGTAVLVIHAVNPWGMAWWRRQNESNVDLNRNWNRSRTDPPRNEAYEAIHPLACPDTESLPSVEDLMASALTLVSEHGLEWIKDGITRGQYTHSDGLHFGGFRTEESTRTVERLASDLVGVERALVVDLHTGHGPPGELTLLSDQPPGSAQDLALRSLGPRVEPTVGNPEATTWLKSGQIANGIRDLLGPDRCHATSAEFGTASDEEQLVATYLETWVHRHGGADRPEHPEVSWRYRCCFTPADPQWEERCLSAGSTLLDAALGWTEG